MSPVEKVKHLIVLKAKGWGVEVPEDLSPEDAYQWLVDNDDHYEAQDEVRPGEIETDVESEWSRHYESKSVAARYIDGSWVGWTYWYGGGKHGDPGSVEWIEYAYGLDCTEEEKLVIVRTFTKLDD